MSVKVAPAVREGLVRRLAAAGCVAAEDEAGDLLAAARDPAQLRAWVDRRLAGEPLAWVIGGLRFCGLDLRVEPGVYVPRWQSEALAERAARRLAPAGRAADLCTGSGALATVLSARVPGVEVVGTDLDPAAVACARANGVDARLGDLFDPLPGHWAGRVDVVTAVAPYVPTGGLRLLPRDSIEHEPRVALDGGPDGLDTLRRIVSGAGHWMRPGGFLLLELGHGQDEGLAATLARAGFVSADRIEDDEGELRGLECVLGTVA